MTLRGGAEVEFGGPSLLFTVITCATPFCTFRACGGWSPATTIAGRTLDAVEPAPRTRSVTLQAEARVDLTAGDGHISWVNDLERDVAYSRWPRSLRELLQPLFPGQVGCSLSTSSWLILQAAV